MIRIVVDSTMELLASFHEVMQILPVDQIRVPSQVSDALGVKDGYLLATLSVAPCPLRYSASSRKRATSDHLE